MQLGRFINSLKSFAANVSEIRAKPGDIVPLELIDKQLSENKYKLLTLTHVDTSTGVFMDVGNICKFVKNKYPDVLVCIDAVCSALSEPIYFDEWKADIVLTASQKGLGVPPGLSLMLISPDAIKVFKERQASVIGYYTSWANWIPIMKSYENKKPSYFGTPSVQLIFALETALKHHIENGVDNIYKKHKEASDWFKSEIHSLGLKTLPLKDDYAAKSMTAVYYPEGVTAMDFLPAVSKKGITIAGGIHPEIAGKYFRVGHMGITVVERNRKYLEKTLDAIKHALKK